MQNTSTRRFLKSIATFTAVAILSMSGWTLPASAALDVPQILSFQGRLTDASRITVDDASYSMKFSIYTAASGGSCLWTAKGTCGTPTTLSVTVTDGVFSVLLGDTSAGGGSQNAFDDTVFDDYSALYLGVTIGSDSEMSPRKRVVASAFAMQSGDSDLLDSLNTDDNGCTGACVPVTNGSGNLAVTGTAGATADAAPLYVNPSTSVDANDILFGVSASGSARFTVDEDGDATFGSNNSTDTTLKLYNSNNTYGTVTGSRYSSYDSIEVPSVLESVFGSVFAYNGLQISASPNTATPLYVEEAAFDGAVDAGSNRDDAGLFINTSSAAYTSSGSYKAIGIKIRTAYTGAATNSSAYGLDARLTVEPSATLSAAYGLYGSLAHNSAQTLTNAYGVYGITNNVSSGTITNAMGVYGVSAVSSGTVTNGYGGLFKALGATNDYAVYTAEGLVQIEGDATPTTPTTATTDGELFVVGDIESDANLNIGGFAAVGTTPTSTEALRVDKTYASFGSSTRTSGYARAIATGANGVGSSLIGQDVAANVNTSGAADMVERLMGIRSLTTHASTGTVSEAYGVTTAVDLSNASGTISTGVGVKSVVSNSGSGTLTVGIGLYAGSSGGTADMAIYAADGYVHIEGDSTRTSPVFTGVGGTNDGSLFVRNNVEIFNGSLCVGGAGNDCSNATGTAGIIYSTAASVTAHDLAEMFPSHQFLLAGEIVSADSAGDEYVRRSSGNDVILGAVSTTPGLTLGWGGENEYPIALTGRTPIKVNGEGGAIAIGDRIGLSSVAGVGKKTTGAGEVVGVAMQAFSGTGEGAVMTFVSPEHWNGSDVATVTASEATPTVSSLSDNGVLSVQENRIGNIATLRGYNWSVSDAGIFTTEGSYDVRIHGHQGADVATHTALSIDHVITLAGSTGVQGDIAVVDFEKVSPTFNDVISATRTPMIIATVSEGGGIVSITRKDQNGFTIQRESGNPTRVDWVAYAYRKGYEPEEREMSGGAGSGSAGGDESGEVGDEEVKNEDVSVVAPAEVSQPSTEPVEQGSVVEDDSATVSTPGTIDAVSSDDVTPSPEVPSSESTPEPVVEAVVDATEVIPIVVGEPTVSESTDSTVVAE